MMIGIGIGITAGVGRGGESWPLTVLEAFDSDSGWTLVDSANAEISIKAGGGVLAPDAINFASDTGGSNNASITKNQNWDLSAEAGVWLLYRVNFRQVSAQHGLTLYLSHSTALASGIGRMSIAGIPSPRAVGRGAYWIPHSAWGTVDGSPTFESAILSMRARIDSSVSTERNWDLLGLTLERRHPTVILTQDDGFSSAYSFAFAECQARGIRQTQYIIPSLLGNTGYISLAQANEMKAAGEHIALHGAARWDQDLARIASDATALGALGFDTEHAAYPNGETGDGTDWLATVAALKDAGVKTARLAGVQSLTLRHRVDGHCLPSYPLSSSLTLAAAKAVIDAAIASGGTAIFYGHKYGASADGTTWAEDDFTDLLDYIVEKRTAGQLRTQTIKQWWG